MKKNSWSEDDLRTLRLYAREGRSVYRIAAALDRTVPSVRSMANRLGLSIQSNRTPTSSDTEGAALR
jgi:hypothetical protein